MSVEFIDPPPEAEGWYDGRRPLPPGVVFIPEAHGSAQGTRARIILGIGVVVVLLALMEVVQVVLVEFGLVELERWEGVAWQRALQAPGREDR